MVDRALRLFADVRQGEGRTAVLLACNVFLILTAYYVLKPVREALILGEGSPELKTYLSLVQVGLLSVAVPLYGRLAAWLSRGRLINVVTWFFVGCLLTFFFLARSGVPVAVPFFLWIGVFNLMILAQFWAFANDLYTREEGERLFPIVGFGASLGAVLGAVIAGWLLVPLGIHSLLLVGAVLLIAQLQLTNYLDQGTSRASRPGAAPPREDAVPGKAGNAFSLVLGTPYLRLIAFMVMLAVAVDTVGEYLLGSIVTDGIHARGLSADAAASAIGAFYSRYFALINGAGLLVQLLLVSRIVKYLGVRTAVAIVPVIQVASYLVLGAGPGLGLLLAMKVTEKSTDYSLNGTVRQMLFLPCTRMEKYAGKQAIDAFFFRMGDVLAAGIVFLGSAAALSISRFAHVNVGLALTTATLAVFVGRGYSRRLPPHTSLPAASLRRVSAMLILCLVAAPALAQETRAEVIAEQQAAKAQELEPYEPNVFERFIVSRERRLRETRSHFFPYFASVYGGGGLTLGAGFRHYYNEQAAWEIRGLYSIKNYKLIEAATQVTDLADGTVKLEVVAGWRDATQVGFYGLGMNSAADDRANYRFHEAYGRGIATLQPVRWFAATAGLTFENYQLMSGQGSDPSIETAYTPVTAPGLGSSPSFFHSEFGAAVDTRPAPGYARTGGEYRITLHDYVDVGSLHDFQRLDAEVVQHVPILRETWVFSLRARAETTLGDDEAVPYFLLPSLGSGSTLRGYATGRFRDRHALLTQAEWRWIPNRMAFDMAIFFDAGKVAATRSGLGFDNLAHNWGVGARFHTPAATPLRVEIAKGSDGWNLVFSGNAAF